jgi:hypothetical protein
MRATEEGTHMRLCAATSSYIFRAGGTHLERFFPSLFEFRNVWMAGNTFPPLPS